MRRAPLPTPARFALLASTCTSGAVIVALLDVLLGDDDLRWSSGPWFGLFLFALQTGLALARRRTERDRGRPVT